jgi:TetR/AcrR family transcriptional regulator, transcriptional repressor of bet genes
MPRPSNTEERRRQITSGLMVAMAKHGYDGASIGDIAKAAALAPGLVHYHFKSKQEILIALAEQLVEQDQQGLAAFLARYRGNALQTLDAIIDFYLKLHPNADPAILACWIALSSEAQRNRKVGKVFAGALGDLHERIRQQVALGIDSGEFRDVVPNQIAAAIVATVQGYFVLAGTARDLIPKGSAARSTQAMLRGLLKGCK